MRRKILAAIAAVGLAGSLAACSSSDMPSQAEMATGFDTLMESSGVDVSQLAGENLNFYETSKACIVAGVEDSGNEELGKALASGDPNASGSDQTVADLDRITQECTDAYMNESTGGATDAPSDATDAPSEDAK